MSRKFYLFLGIQLALAAVALGVLLSRPGAWDISRVAGSGLLLIGIVLLFTARLQLGKSFAITPQARELVTHGLYSRVRNPIYVFGTLAFTGVILMLHRPSLWLLVAAVVTVQTLRARQEAKVLEAKFGESYREYRRKTWF